MKTTIVCVTAVLGAVFVSAPALAQETAAPTPEITVTGTAAVLSQYRFRGIAQSDNKPVVQMSVTVQDKSGFYISAWGSSASSNGDDVIDIGGTEIDVYGGYSHTFAKSGVTVDGGLYGYLYPGAASGEYYELYGDVSKAVGPFGLKVGANWAPKQHYFDYFDTATKYNMYEYGEVTFSPPKLSAVTLHTHLGHTGGGFNYTKAYWDYTAGASYKWKNLTFDASVVGTNVSKSDAREAPLTTIDGEVSPFQTYRAAKAVGVISLTASF